MDTMGMFSASLGYDCVMLPFPGNQHQSGPFAVATPQMQRARGMMVLMMERDQPDLLRREKPHR